MKAKPKTNGKARQYPPASARRDYTVQWMPIGKVQPSPENEAVYGETSYGMDEAFDALTESIRERGLAEPILLTRDRYVLSGHRRLVACQALGYTRVPVVVDASVRRKGNTQFHKDLIEFNPQRVKSVGDVLRETLLRNNQPADTYAAIKERREAGLRVDAEFMQVDGEKPMREIGARREAFLHAVQAKIDELSDLWPLSCRQIHYALLNDPPLRLACSRSAHDAEHFRYRNDKTSYNALTRLLRDARYNGSIPMNVIDDPTRPQKTWGGWHSVAEFVQEELDLFLVNYHRNRQQGQPRHIEVFAEKNTLYNTTALEVRKHCCVSS